MSSAESQVPSAICPVLLVTGQGTQGTLHRAHITLHTDFLTLEIDFLTLDTDIKTLKTELWKLDTCYWKLRTEYSKVNPGKLSLETKQLLNHDMNIFSSAISSYKLQLNTEGGTLETKH